MACSTVVEARCPAPSSPAGLLGVPGAATGRGCACAAYCSTAETMNERLHGCGDCAIRSLAPDLLQDLGAGPLGVGLEQRQDLLPDACERAMWRVQPAQDILTARRRLLVICLLRFFLGRR